MASAPDAEDDLPWRGFALIAGVFLLLALTSNLLFPPFDGPDENSHFQYALLLAQGKGLPVQTDPERSADAEGFGPPLYYVVPAIILAALDPDRGAAIRRIGVISYRELAEMASRPGLPAMNPRWVSFGRGEDPNLFIHPQGGPLARGPVRVIHFMRLFSTLCGLATLFAVFLLAREAAPGRREIQVLGVALVAFNPQFVYLSGLLNNDTLVTAFATVALWWTVRLQRGEKTVGRTDALVLGACLGLGMLAKPSVLFLLAPIAAVLWLRSSRPRAFIAKLGLVVTVAGGIAGWFYIRNAWLYGGLDFLGLRTRSVIQPIYLLPPERRWRFLTRVLPPMLLSSFWGSFGWLTLHLRFRWYAFYGLVSAASLGTLLPLRGPGSKGERGTLLLLWATVAGNLASLLAFNFVFRAEQGRLLFPSIGAWAMLMALGIERASSFVLPSHRFPSAARVPAYALTVALLASVLIVQWVVIFPVYFP